MNSDFSYLASKRFNLTSKPVEKLHMSERQSVNAVPNAEQQLVFFLNLSYKAHKKR